MSVYLFTYDALVENDGSLSTEIKNFLYDNYGENNVQPILKSVFLVSCHDTHKKMNDKIKSQFGKRLSYVITKFSKCYQDNKLEPEVQEWLKKFIPIRYIEIPIQ